MCERLICNKLTAHLTENDLICSSQHGFLSKRSTLTNLLEFITFVGEAYDTGENIDVLYFDLQKAFDKVPHDRLIFKIEKMGVCGKVLQWVTEWLRERKQRVVLNGEMSSWKDVLSGVPQGSVLGPVLFLIYVDDLDNDVVNKLLKFADDTKLFGIVSDNQQCTVLEQDLSKIINWSDKWLMPFNVDKCCVMHIGKQNLVKDYKIKNQSLKSVTEEKDLGIIIQDDLQSSKQCLAKCQSANKILGMIYRSIECKNRSVVLKLYKSLVRPVLEYCIPVWSPYLQKESDALEKIQRRATKMIKDIKHLSYEERLSVLGLTTLRTRRLRGDLILMYKVVKGLVNVDVSKFFKFDTNHLRGHQFKVYKNRFRTNIGKNLFKNRIINEWNSLSKYVVDADSLNEFKSRLDHHLKYNRGFT